MPALTIPDAAERLGTSADTVRRRLRAGTLAGYRETEHPFRWMVTLDGPEGPQDGPGRPPSAGHGSAPSTGEVIALRELISTLQEQLTARTREVQELHVILAQRGLPSGLGSSEPEASEGQVQRKPTWWDRLRGAQG